MSNARPPNDASGQASPARRPLLRTYLSAANAATRINSAEASVFCPTGIELQLGQAVLVELKVRGGPTVFMPGVVHWQRPQPCLGDLPAGVCVKIDHSARRTLTFVHDWHQRAQEDRRRSARFPMRLQLAYDLDDEQVVNVTDNLSRSGAFVLAEQPAALDRMLELRLLPSRYGGPLRLRGAVTRRVQQGPRPGMGLQFMGSEQDLAQYVTLVTCAHYSLVGANRRQGAASSRRQW